MNKEVSEMDYKKKLAKRCEQLGFTLTVEEDYYDKGSGNVDITSYDVCDILATEIKIPKTSDVEIDDLTFVWGSPDSEEGDPDRYEIEYSNNWYYDDGTNLQVTCWKILEEYENWVVTHNLDKLLEDEKNECN